MKREDDEQLWDLLGRGAEPKLSPFFARNVLRRVREDRLGFWRALAWLTPRRLVPVSALAAAVIAALIFAHNADFRQESTDNDVDLLAKIDPQDYDVVADLDDLLASDENNLWDDDDTTSL